MFRQGFTRGQQAIRPKFQLECVRPPWALSLQFSSTAPGRRAYSKHYGISSTILQNGLRQSSLDLTVDRSLVHRRSFERLHQQIYRARVAFSTCSSKNFPVGLTRDTKREEELKKETLKADPEAVSTTSTVVPIFGGPPHGPSKEEDIDMLKGLKSDLKVVRDTFQLSDVPRDVLLIGMAGVIPYVVTSLSTICLAWDLNYAQLHGQGYLLSHETAMNLMQILEPMQVGYGAVIISFLGAIHWGLEFAGYGGRKSRRRYAIGLLAPALAWPTIIFPLHLALLTQFFGFTAIYFFDAAATTAGLAPPWYSTYRFVLTFIVGASIILTLIGRGQLDEKYQQAPRPVKSLEAVKAEQRQNLEHGLKHEPSPMNPFESGEGDEEASDEPSSQANHKATKEDEHENDGNENDKQNSDDNESQAQDTDDSESKQKEARRAKAAAKIDAEREKNSNSGSGKSGMESPSGGRHVGGVYPGDDNEPIRQEMRAKPSRRPAGIQGPEYGPEKKGNVEPVPERKY